MYRVILLSFGLALVALGNAENKKCERLIHGGMRCCVTASVRDPITDDMKECHQLQKNPVSCEMEICMAQKMGYASADGTIDKKAFIDKMENIFENNPDVADSIKDKCVNGDLSKYGKEDFCEVIKLKNCADVQVLRNCVEWNDQDECKGIKDLAAECTKYFD